MELGPSTYPLCSRGKESRAEVQGARYLAKAGSWNDTNASGIKQAQTVEVVGFLSCFFGGLDSTLGQVDGWEEVHGPLPKSVNELSLGIL